MIQANCRARFTAADFDFVVLTLARSQYECVSLVDLLSDSETRDSVLDSPRLIQAILCNDAQLRISSQFYFYVLARYVLRDAGVRDRKLCDYVGSLLENFSRAHVLQGPQADHELPRRIDIELLRHGGPRYRQSRDCERDTQHDETPLTSTEVLTTD